MNPASPARRSTVLDAGWAVPAVVLLLVQIALYLWMAPRGFEFTDESYYFHNFLHWREFTGTVTFFGAYFEWPFRMMDQSVGGIRVVSLLLVLASGAVLMHQLLRYSLRAQFTAGARAGTALAGWWYLAAPMTSATLYFGFLTTLRAPSYNLLSLCAAAVSTACLLHIIAQREAVQPSRWAPLLYGVALGACFLSKATTAVLLVASHGLFFLAANRDWGWKSILLSILLAAAGFAINLVLLTAEFPGWLQSLREGIALVGVRGGHGVVDMLRELKWDLGGAVVRAGPGLLLMGLVFALVRRRLRADSRAGISLVAIALVAVIVVTTAGAYQTTIWLFTMAAAGFGLFSLELLARPGRLARGDRTELALMMLLFFLPIAFSFGTNMSVLAHSAIASMFAYCAVYLRLYRLSHQGMLHRGALSVCVCLLCIPAITTQVLALTNVKFTYRQRSALGEQDVPVALGTHGTVLRVTRGTAATLHDIEAMAKAAGFQPGQDLLDLSGDGPGIIYVLGANPLGTPWNLGGYPGSTAAADRIIEKLDPAVVRRAWLLTSTNNPRRILDWEPMLAHRIGPGSHQLAASIDITSPYSWSAEGPQAMKLQLWKPVAPAAAQGH